MIESDIIQIEMELDRLNWNHSFLKIQEEQLKPIYYFKIQSKYYSLQVEFKMT